MLFNVRISPEDQAALSEAAKKLGCSKSEVARAAIAAYVQKMSDDEKRDETLLDDWNEYGAAVLDAFDALVGSQVAKLDALRKAFVQRMDEIRDMEWEQSIEPVYKVFRSKVIEKSEAFDQNPWINNLGPEGPVVIGAIGFAADDIHELKIPLEQLFYDYGDFAGYEAFDEIPAILARARARLEAEDQAR